MTSAADLRSDARDVLLNEGVGQPIAFVPAGSGGSAGGDVYDPATGTLTPAPGGAGSTAPSTLTGIGRITRFSDALAAGGLIKDNDRKIVWYPDNPAAVPDLNGRFVVTNADGSTETYDVVALNARTLGGAVLHWIVQGRR